MNKQKIQKSEQEMHNTNWEDINSLIKTSFQDYDEIEPKNTRETKSELLRLLQDMRVPLSPYLVNAICNDPVFFNALLWGVDMMSVSGEEVCLPLLDVLIVISNSRTVKIQNNSRPEMKTLLTGNDKEILEKMLIDKIEELQNAGILEEGWTANPGKAKRNLIHYIKSVTVERKEVKGQVYLGLYNSIPWPSGYKETDKCILIYRIGLLLGLDSQNEDDSYVLNESDYKDDKILRQELYHKVSSVLRVQRQREAKKIVNQSSKIK